MSVEAITIALHHSTASGSAKLVLIGIANHVGDGGAWPSMRTLSKYANIDIRNVRKAVEELEDLGEVKRLDDSERDLVLPARIRDGEKPNVFEFLLTCPPDCDRTMNHRVDAAAERERRAQRLAAKKARAAQRKAEREARAQGKKPSLAEAVKTIADWQDQAYEALGPGDGYVDETSAAPAPAALVRPDRCPQHQHDLIAPPCGGCAEAGRIMKAAEERDQREAAAKERAERQEMARLKRAEIDACNMCDATGWDATRGRSCDHDPAALERRRRGAEAAREALRAQGINVAPAMAGARA